MLKHLLLAIFLLAASIVSIAAQGNPEQAVLAAREQFSDIKNRSMELERMKRESNKRPVNKDFTLKFPEIKEDFEKIQKLNSELRQLAFAKTPNNYEVVSKLASEINHRARRLDSNLFTSEPKQRKQPKEKKINLIEPANLETLLSSLDKNINGFVHSSMFKNLNLVNSADALKARKNLEAVINVSREIEVKTKN